MSIPKTWTHRCDCDLCEAGGKEFPYEPWEIRAMEENLGAELAHAIEREIDAWMPARSKREAAIQDLSRVARITIGQAERRFAGYR